MESYYQILGVSADATEADIKRAWAREVRNHPPDEDPGRNRLISEAKGVLLDPVARENYDAEQKYGEEIKALHDEAIDLIVEEDYSEAIHLLKEVLALQPGFHDARNLLGVCFVRLEDYAAAISTFEDLISRVPDSSLYYSNLAQSSFYYANGDFSILDAAQSLAEKAIALQGHNSDHYILLSQILINKELLKDAEQVLEGALLADGKLDIDDIDTFMKLAEIFVLQGNPDRTQHLAGRIASVVEDNFEAGQYAIYRLVQLGVVLKTECDDVHAAAELMRAASKIGDLEGAVAEVAESIELESKFSMELKGLSGDSSIQPRAVAGIYVCTGLRSLGEDVPESSFEEVIQAANTWSKLEIRNAVSAIRRKYPTVYAHSGSINDNIFKLGHDGGTSAAGRQDSSGCFIATAVYGRNAPETNAFRCWRDQVLIHSFVGRCFVKGYYLVSPAVVKVIAGRRSLILLFRILLGLVAKIAGLADVNRNNELSDG